MEATLIDRGIDYVLKTKGKTIRVDKMSAIQLINTLNDEGLSDIKTVNYSEYEESEEYDPSLI